MSSELLTACPGRRQAGRQNQTRQAPAYVLGTCHAFVSGELSLIWGGTVKSATPNRRDPAPLKFGKTERKPGSKPKQQNRWRIKCDTPISGLPRHHPDYWIGAGHTAGQQLRATDVAHTAEEESKALATYQARRHNVNEGNLPPRMNPRPWQLTKPDDITSTRVGRFQGPGN
jgi:hypothetical protein